MFKRRQWFLLILLCSARAWAAPVQQPQLLKQIGSLETSWFASPAIYDLDGDGSKELIATYYSIYVFDSQGNQLDKLSYEGQHLGRIYAPAVVADLEGDGITEIVAGGSKGRIGAYEWRDRKLRVKTGWPAVAYDGDGMEPEVRSLAGADLDNDGRIEIIAATTQTDDGEPQVYVYTSSAQRYQPPGIAWQAWPRYNRLRGPGNDADANGAGNSGYGCFGENIGVGNLDDDPELEIVVTFDNHQINVFDHTGVSHLASEYFTNRSSEYAGRRLNWGQFIRWYDASVEESHYHLHQGTWPHPSREKWLQWTDSPANVIDVNGDGRNEVVAVANVELKVPYETQHYSVMALEGNYGDGSRSARRLAGWEILPGSAAPQSRGNRSWYPPAGIPAPTTINIIGDERPEIIVPMNDGYIYAFSPDAQRMWRWDFTHGRALMYASEVVAGDLNQDGQSELIFTTYGDPDSIRPGVPHGYLVVLDSQGQLLHDIVLPTQGTNGNGKGAPAAPTLGDLNGDGTLEIAVQTFDAHLFLYSVPGSASNLLLWPTGRGSRLRQGRPAMAQPAIPLRVLTAELSRARVGAHFSARLAAAGGSGPYQWQVAAGALPPGLTLTASGELEGIPSEAKACNFTIQVTDAAGAAAARELALRVLPAAQPATVRGASVSLYWTRKNRDRYRVRGWLNAPDNPLTPALPVWARLGGVTALAGAPLSVENVRAAAGTPHGKAALEWQAQRQRLAFDIRLQRENLRKPYRVRRSKDKGKLRLTFEMELGDILYSAPLTMGYRRINARVTQAAR